MQSSEASGAIVLAVLGAVPFLLGLAIAMFAGDNLERKGTVAGTLMGVGLLFALILIIEVNGDAPPLEPARPGPYPVPSVPGGGQPPGP